MKKHLNLVLFGAVVLVVAFLAWNHSRHMSALIAAITSGNSGQRAGAARELIAGEQFSDVIAGEHKAVRVQAALALGDLGNADAVKQLLPLLKDEAKRVRAAALQQLERIGGANQSNLDAVMSGLSDGDLNVRKGTIEALTDQKGGIGPRTRPDVVADLLKTLQSTADARRPVGDVLSSPLFDPSANSRSVPGLVAMLDNSDDTVVSGAADALGKIGDPSGAQPLIALVNNSKTSKSVVRVAIGAIALIASPPTQPTLIAALQNHEDDSNAREQAAAGLGKLATPQAVSALLESLTDNDLSIREAAVAGLARAARPGLDSPVNTAVTTQIVGALNGTNTSTQYGIIEALRSVKSTLADDALTSIVKNPVMSVSLREQAVQALGFRGNASAVPTLAALLSDPSGMVDKEAGNALAAIGPAAVPTLTGLLAKQNVVAYYAATALGQEGSVNAVVLQALQQAAQSHNTNVQRWAAYALGQTGVAAARPALQQLAQSSDPDVQFVARQQLASLPGS